MAGGFSSGTHLQFSAAPESGGRQPRHPISLCPEIPHDARDQRPNTERCGARHLCCPGWVVRPSTLPFRRSFLSPKPSPSVCAKRSLRRGFGGICGLQCVQPAKYNICVVQCPKPQPERIEHGQCPKLQREQVERGQCSKTAGKWPWRAHLEFMTRGARPLMGRLRWIF